MVVIIHFNKRNSANGLPWTVHVRGKCIQASKVHIEVPTETIFKPEKKTNPRAWMRCNGHVVQLGYNEVQICKNPEKSP